MMGMGVTMKPWLVSNAKILHVCHAYTVCAAAHPTIHVMCIFLPRLQSRYLPLHLSSPLDLPGEIHTHTHMFFEILVKTTKRTLSTSQYIEKT